MGQGRSGVGDDLVSPLAGFEAQGFHCGREPCHRSGVPVDERAPNRIDDRYRDWGHRAPRVTPFDIPGYSVLLGAAPVLARISPFTPTGCFVRHPKDCSP